MPTSRVGAAARAALAVLLLCWIAPGAARAVDLRLSGRVVDAETQAPIAGAVVELANTGGGQGYFRARTDGHGGFALVRIPAERWYSLTATADGYADYVLGSWQFPSAQRAAEVVIPLDRAGSITLKLTASDGHTPIVGAKVQARPEEAAEWWRGFRPPPAPLFTDAQGTVRFTDLARGYYTVTAEASDRMPFEARRVAVRRGETTPLSASLALPAFVSGFVRLADGTPVAGLTVTARGPAEAVGTTLADGSFTAGGLPPGRYHLAVTHEGFEPAALQSPVTLREAESRGGFAITVTPRPAELAFVLEREAFGVDEPVKVGLRSYRVGYVDYALFEIPPDRLLRGGARSGSLPAPEDTAGLTLVQRWQKPTAEGAPWTWREEELTLPETMLPGAYLLVGRAGALERRAVLFVTDLSLIVKRSKTQLVISAASLKSGRPVPGAHILIARGTGPGMKAGPAASPPGAWRDALSRATPAPAGPIATDESGIARVPLAGDPIPVRVLASSESNGLSVVDAPVAPAAEQGGDALYLYTDRPIYRPGQTVYWKAFVRRATDHGYAPPESTHVALALAGPGGATLEIPRPAHAGAGSADGSIALPIDVALGDWSLSAADGRARGTAGFAVEEYRKPEFRVEVTPDREIYVNGDEVRFRVAASYFFGAPVFGALVRYNLFESRLPGDEEWWSGEEEGGPEPGYGRVLKSGETRTDLDGRVALSFVPARATYDRRLTLEVEVVDPAERRVSGRGSVVVGRGLFALTVKPLARVVAANEPVGIEVTTRDHAGKPVRALVRVTLDQDAWNPLERRFTRAARPLAEAQVTTDSTGHGFVPLRAGRSGDLEIRARAEDARGNLVTAETSVWVWDAKISEYAYRYPSLEVLADRARYAPGDTATLVINTDVRDATALAVLEGREVEDLRVIAIRGNTGIVRFPIRPDDAPNAFVTVHVRKAREVRARTLELQVAAARHDLAITLTPDQAEYRPGETAKVAVRTADAGGAPVAAELSLGVVDEAIYSLRADATPDPHDVFYGRRPDWVTTVISFPTLYYGGADKGGREEVRKDFRDVADWEPSVITGADGRGTVSFRWPDNLTTWRLTSRGATASTLVGKAVEKVLVSKPLVARLSGPRAFVEGDRATLISGVTNRSRAPLTGVEERLEAAGPVTIEGRTSRRTDLPAGGESRGEWPVVIRPIPARADTVPQAIFTFHARAKSDADALETGIPVLPRAVPLRPHGAGALAGSEAAIAVALPGDLVRPGSSVTLELSPSIAAMALGARDYLAAYPWGCTEQTANALRAALDLAMVEKKLGVSFPGARDSSAAVRRGIERLVALQHGDGGWGWWSEGETDPYLSALALDALARASFAGRAGPEVDGALQRGAMAMLPLLDQVRTEDGEAYVLMHLGGLLSLPNAKERFAGLGSRLDDLALATSSARDKLSDAGLALCALGHMNLGRMDEARALVHVLAGRAIEDGAGVHWRGSADSWFDGDVEATAYALSALNAASPADPRAPGALRWLAAQRRADHWRSTRATAPVAIALGDWLLTHPEEAKPQYRLDARWNGAPLLARTMGAADVFGRGERVVIPGSKLAPGENRLALTKSGTGSLFWSWEARALVPSPGPSTAAEKRLSLTREYLHAERTTDLRGRPRWLTTPLERGQAFASGEAVLVRLTIHAAGALDHLILEDPRPAGFEVDDLVPEGTEHPWDLHAEARDTRSVFFLSRLDEGDTVLEYLVRPETAGTVVALPASLGAMYDPDLVVRSGEGTAVVSGGPSR